MIPHHLSTDFNSLKTFVQSLYPYDHEKYIRVVSEVDQIREIELLKETIGGERFFFIVDMPNFEMNQCYGVSRWLGYSDNQFSLMQYWDKIVHPSFKKSLLLLVMQMYELLSTGTYPLEFMVQRFSSLIPLRHYNGHYLLTKKISSVFQYDNNNRLLAYMDEFTIVGQYNDNVTSIDARMFNSYGQRELEKEQAILKQTMERFLAMRVFAAKELQVARKLAYSDTITRAELAENFKISQGTIDTYFKRILQKTRVFFKKNEKEIPTAFSAAVYLKKEGLI